MIRVVIGRAIIIPRMPSRLPQIESDKRIIAGFIPIVLPIILGVNIKSATICTTAYTAIHCPQSAQKDCSPVVEQIRQRKVTGIMVINCKYGTMNSTPIISPRTIARGIPTILNPIQ